MIVLSNLSHRERMLVIGAAILVAIFAILQFAVLPVVKGKAAANSAHAVVIRDLDIVRRAAPNLGMATQGQSKQKFERDSVLSAARRAGLSISRVQPSGENDLQIWFDDAPASALYDMLSALSRDYAVIIQRADVKRQEGGTVSVQVTLRPTS